MWWRTPEEPSLSRVNRFGAESRVTSATGSRGCSRRERDGFGPPSDKGGPCPKRQRSSGKVAMLGDVAAPKILCLLLSMCCLDGFERLCQVWCLNADQNE